jgi:hypothetical protein
MICGHCGTEVRDGFRTCPSCGARYERRIGSAPRNCLIVSIVSIVLFFICTELSLQAYGDTDWSWHQVFGAIGAFIGAIFALWLRKKDFDTKVPLWWR